MAPTREDRVPRTSQPETPATSPDTEDAPDEGVDESLELTYPASDPPRPVRVRPDSDTASGRPPVRSRRSGPDDR